MPFYRHAMRRLAGAKLSLFASIQPFWAVIVYIGFVGSTQRLYIWWTRYSYTPLLSSIATPHSFFLYLSRMKPDIIEHVPVGSPYWGEGWWLLIASKGDHNGTIELQRVWQTCSKNSHEVSELRCSWTRPYHQGVSGQECHNRGGFYFGYCSFIDL